MLHALRSYHGIGVRHWADLEAATDLVGAEQEEPVNIENHNDAVWITKIHIMDWAGTNFGQEMITSDQASSLAVRIATKGFDRPSLEIISSIKKEIIGFSKDAKVSVGWLAEKENAEAMADRIVENVEGLLK